MEEFWATEVLRVYAALLLATWGFRAVCAWFGEPTTRARAWALRMVLLLVVAHWLGAL